MIYHATKTYVQEEHKRGIHFALDNSSKKFTEVIMISYKVIPGNLVVVR